MKTIKPLALALTALALTCQLACAATTSELLQQGLYAEEVEGNMDSAIKAYSQVIQNKSAPPAHVAQALYRQGMCYLKVKDEASARTVLEKLVAEHSTQTELVDKARPVLDDLTDFDPAALMPPGTLVYLEFGSPGRQIETILTMLKGTPYENPLAVMAGPNGKNGNQKSPGDIVGALLNPSMMAEFKKIRSSAIGVTSIEMEGQNHPHMIAVLYPGKSDALRGLILAGLGMAGTAGTPIEGLSVVNLPEDMAVAYDDKIVIMARPASQLSWCVKQYKHLSSEPTLASSNKSFAKLSKNQRQKNILTVWANVDESYDQVLKMFPPGRVPPQLLSANAFADFHNIDDLIFTESIEATGIGSRLEFQFKDGHHCLAYGMIRTPNISKVALEAVPAEAVAVASFALNQPGIQTEQVRSQIQTMTGLDIGREIFANIEQITIFALPIEAGATNITRNTLPGRLGLAITSRNPEQTKQVLSTLLATANPAANPQNGRYKVGASGGQDIYCHLDQVNKTTLLSLNRDVINASATALKNRKSAAASGPLQRAVADLTPAASKLFLVNVGGALRLAGPLLKPKSLTEAQLKDWNASFEQLASAATATTIELRTDEQLNGFAISSSLTDIPPLNQILGPVTQLNRLNDQARTEATARKLQKQTPAIILPATKAPAIDGNEDEAWARIPRNKIKKVITSFGSGEKASAPSSPDDLAADYRAMWDGQNLYLLVDVTDDKLVNDNNPDQPVTVPTGSTVIPWWYDDSVEIYLDADNSKSPEYDKNDAHIRLNWNATKPVMHIYNQNVETQLPGVEFAMIATAKGYRAEIKVPWAAFWLKPSLGARFGLDVHVNDDDDGGERDCKITWHTESDTAWQSPQAFGNGLLAGLVGWWKFDETEGAIAADSSGNGHRGSLRGNPIWRPQGGKRGGAIELDGKSAFVEIANESAFDISGQLTISTWVNIKSVPQEWTAIVTKGDTGWRLATEYSQKAFHFGADAMNWLNGTTEVNASQWHHVLCVYDGQKLSTYLDGKLDISKPWSGALGSNDFPVCIGENAEQPGRFWHGLIDDVRIYNYALSTDEIKALAAGQ
jgi:hypothetical protein